MSSPWSHSLRFALLLFALLMGSVPAFAQSADASPDTTDYGTGAGLQLRLTNNGFGLGGYYSEAINSQSSFWVELSLGAGKDENEIQFLNRFGGSFIPDKRNYLLLLPVQFGAQRRLFKESIEDNFRPYVQLTGGPTFGWEYPYFDDRDGNDRYDDEVDERLGVFTAFPQGNLHFGLGGTLAFGAYFGTSHSVVQGVRFGYTFSYFFQGVQLLEPQVKDAQNFFSTPVITLTFGRLF